MMMKIAGFLVDCMAVLWVIGVIIYVVFYIQWKRGKVKIKIK